MLWISESLDYRLKNLLSKSLKRHKLILNEVLPNKGFRQPFLFDNERVTGVDFDTLINHFFVETDT